MAPHGGVQVSTVPTSLCFGLILGEPMLQQALSGKRILIVEDEYTLAAELAEFVESAGGIVMGPVPSLAFAFEAIQEHRPDAAILDVLLSSGDSIALAEHLRDLEVPFIFATGCANVIPSSLNSVQVFQKPVCPNSLTLSLGQMLTLREGAPEVKAVSGPQLLYSVDGLRRSEILRIAEKLSQRTGQTIKIFDEDMIEIASLPAP